MKLVVLAGAKAETVIPLKKERFVIGRSKGCSLRAGSEAISRQHCELVQGPQGTTVQDLGSRNGTFVNDERIEGARALSHGDLLRIGPLEFRVEADGELGAAKQPKVTGVGEALARSSQQANLNTDDQGLEESISGWLFDEPAPVKSMSETHSYTAEETRAIAKQLSEAQTVEIDTLKEGQAPPEEPPAEGAEGEAKAKGPGKLPKDALKPKSKDSREAAMQILRDMARRR